MDLNLDGILGGLGNITETEDIPTIINEFARILAEIINLIKNFFNSLTGGGETTNPEETTTA